MVDVTDKKGFITAVPGQEEQKQQSDDDYDSEASDLDEADEDKTGDGGEKKQYFTFMDAEPPTNYNDPYSTLPKKIKMQTIIRDVQQSVAYPSKKTNDDWDFEKEFKILINQEHMVAIISDAFWYFICTEIKDPKQYTAHNEFLLDRIAANYVSFLLLELPHKKNEKPPVSQKTKDQFFVKFYNHLAQAVYHALKLGFPKNRSTIESPLTKRKLLNTFSLLFTGVVIHSAKFTRWSNQTSTILTNEDLTGVTLADVHRPSGGGPIKSKPVHTEFRYSTIVERYLATHKYETFNNIKGWKMLITHNTEAQKAIDLKFAQYKEIGRSALETANNNGKEYEKMKHMLE